MEIKYTAAYFWNDIEHRHFTRIETSSIKTGISTIDDLWSQVPLE